MSGWLYVLPDLRDDQRRRVLAAADGRIPVRFRQDLDEGGRAEAFASAEIIVGEPKPERLFGAPRLRWLQLTTAGADRYAGAALPPGLTVTCATGAYGFVIAEYLIGAILAVYRHIPEYVRQQERAVWQPRQPSRSLFGASALVLGTGDLGATFARRLRAFGPREILGVRRTSAGPLPDFDEVHTTADLPQLWGRADLVVCCLPGTAATRRLVDEAALRAMRPGALFVNVGRGSLVDPDVLARVLASGHLSGAVLDVCDPEPLPPDHPLWKLDNVLITPHIAGVGFGAVPETAERIVDLLCANLRSYLSGEPLQSRVDLSAGYRRSQP